MCFLTKNILLTFQGLRIIVSMELEEVLQVSFVSEIIWIIFFNLYYLMPHLKHGLHLVQWKKMNSK